MIKKCGVCGREFNAAQPNYLYCSVECRKIRQCQQIAEWQKQNRKRHAELSKESRRRKAKIINCRICGEPVLPYIYNDRVHRKHYHEKCVIREAYKAFTERGAKFLHKSTDVAVIRAKNYGYTKKEIFKLMEDRTND